MIYLQTLTYILIAAAAFYLAVGIYRAIRPVRGEPDIVRDNLLVSIALGVLALAMKGLM